MSLDDPHVTPASAVGGERLNSMHLDNEDNPKIEVLLTQAAEGDESAWRIIVNLYADRVFGLLRTQCGDSDLAEEITQATFCRIASKIASYREVGKFEAWLFRIAVNLLRDELRRRKRHATPTEDQTLVGLAGAAQTDDDAAADPAELMALRAAIGRLSEPEQRILHLRHYAGLGFKQVAEIMEQPIGTVLARHHRALKKLKDMLSGEDPGQ